MNSVFTVAMAADAAGPAQNTDDPNVTSLTDVNVQGQRSTEAVARAQQETAPNLINVTTAEEIRKLPDVNAGEAVRRLPGISLETDTGEGRFVNIRGLDADLTTTTFGGVRLPPTNTAGPFSGGRAVAFDTIPAGMIGSITVTKTNRPDMDAEALGGTIEITPKTLAPGQAYFLEGKVGAGNGLLRSSSLTDVSVSGGLRFGSGSANPNSSLTSYSDKPFSFVGSYSRYEDNRGVDDLEAGYITDKNAAANPKAFSNLEQRYYNYHRTRYGIGGELAYEPDANNRWYVRYYDSGYSETVNRQGLKATFPTATLPTQNPDGSFTATGVTFSKSLRDEHETVSSQVFTLGGKNTIGDTTIDYDVAHTVGTDYRPYDYVSTFTNTTPATVTYNNSNANYPQSTVSGVTPSSTNNFNLTGFSNTPVLTQTKEWSTAANVTTPTHWTSASEEEFKTGVSARMRTNENIVTPYAFTSVPNTPLSSAVSGSPVTYYNGNYQNGYNIDNGYMENLYAQGTGFVADPLNAVNAAAQSTHNTENVFAAYLQEHMTFGKLGLLAGLRVENTDARYNGNSLDANNILTPVAASTSYTNLFPSVQARYELAPQSILRASYSSTIARPGFNQTSAATTVDAANELVTTGNPNLKPTLANNFDLSFEQYLPHAGIISAGVFDKALKDYIVANVSHMNLPNSGAFAGLINPLVTSFANVPSARARGLELNYEQRFTSLPGIWGGLGAGANWTFVNSTVEIHPGVQGMLPSTSRNSANATVFWERNGLDLRLASYYTSRNLLALGGDSSQDIYSEARLSVDFGASYQVTKNYGLFMSLKNLTNTPMKFTEGSSDRVIQREFYGITAEAGATFNF